ncbi:hypothetical protein GH714_003424 [Hevea brasiliensis]|uniref:Protein kinase domain-containing protein n=1 Tax=Hevea brasiliensis TaxID=3981 RepID=A0A6A6NBJ7_HEVBR|nr:hypothetical protein GH714_003424 [Hevea brasiliensis]
MAWKAINIFFLLFYSAAAIDDSAAMLKLANALHPTPLSWSTKNATGYCRWDGVQCDNNDRVIIIYLDRKNLSGTLPFEISTLTKLEHLSLQHNKLSGSLPSLANLTLLRVLFIGDNKFTSIPHDFFEGLVRLQTFDISFNADLAPWFLSSTITQCGRLVYFDAGSANIMGTIPDIFASLPSLRSLYLSDNNLTGTLPASLANPGIEFLHLNNQKIGLSGTIHVLSSMTRLRSVFLQNNQFAGPIPDFSKCQNLAKLKLSDNLFTGIVPTSLVLLTNLKAVILSNNKLQGPVPEFRTNVQANFSGNNFCVKDAHVGCDQQVTTMLEVASALGYPLTFSDSWQGNNACKNWSYITCNEHDWIIAVNFGKQNFTGTLSSSFANLTRLRNLYLNDNNLTASIPESLTKLTQLEVLDVSNNNLTGKIPVFGASVKLITTPGNSLLESNHASTENKVSPSLIAGLLVGIVIFIALLLFLIFKFRVNKRLGRSRSANVHAEWIVHNEAGYHTSNIGNVVIPIEVLQQVTDNFNENNILGVGGFGVVYKGELHDGTKIAVKRMETTAMVTKGMNGFEAEVAVLTKIRHRHLVSLLGYCINGDEAFLVYEYMPQGTLAEHLFEWRERGYSSLNWKQRATIALNVAQGVEYLHNLAQQSFIHRDLKPSNILLGDDMRAKVGDFGLVRNVPVGKYSLETRVAGTFGYLAPEYAATGRVTTKVDVYAFGVILMEMITGRKALDHTMEDKGWMFMHLATWFREDLICRKKISKAIDEALNPDKDTLATIYRVAELAVQCTCPEPRQRPDMGMVVNILAPLAQEWKPVAAGQEY